MPQLGESIAEATVVKFLVKEGDAVIPDQDLMEVETNKATLTVTAPCHGRISQFSARTGESYPVGFEVGGLEVSEDEMASRGLKPPASFSETSPRTGEATNGGRTSAEVLPTVKGLPVPASAGGASYMSPRLKARMAELGLHAADLAGVAGSGAAGRVTIEDFERFVAELEAHRTSEASSMRVAVADAMRRSWTRPLATVALPVCIDPLLAHRKASNPKPGPALYGLRALALALGENSAPAGRLVGSRIVHPDAIDVGFAVEAEDGVLVPVLRGADRVPLLELAPRYNELVELARARRLPPNATGRSVATVTNFGSFGLTWATPIPLPEQSLVLGMGVGRKVPAWSDVSNRFEPVTEVNLTLSFDHRVIDGGAAGRLLGRISALLQTPSDL